MHIFLSCSCLVMLCYYFIVVYHFFIFLFLFFFIILFFFFFFFFFQAEDGIRDVAVTGVQTCALPISDYAVHASILEPQQTSDMSYLKSIGINSFKIYMNLGSHINRILADLDRKSVV